MNSLPVDNYRHYFFYFHSEQEVNEELFNTLADSDCRLISNLVSETELLIDSEITIHNIPPSSTGSEEIFLSITTAIFDKPVKPTLSICYERDTISEVFAVINNMHHLYDCDNLICSVNIPNDGCHYSNLVYGTNVDVMPEVVAAFNRLCIHTVN